MNKYEPKFGRVLIEREVKEKIGSIYIPEAQQKRSAACIGKIIALGETAGWTETLHSDPIQTLKIGDTVIFGRHSGAWLDNTYDAKGGDNDDGKLFICQDQDILAVVKEQS